MWLTVTAHVWLTMTEHVWLTVTDHVWLTVTVHVWLTVTDHVCACTCACGCACARLNLSLPGPWPAYLPVADLIRVPVPKACVEGVPVGREEVADILQGRDLELVGAAQNHLPAHHQQQVSAAAGKVRQRHGKARQGYQFWP